MKRLLWVVGIGCWIVIAGCRWEEKEREFPAGSFKPPAEKDRADDTIPAPVTPQRPDASPTLPR